MTDGTGLAESVAYGAPPSEALYSALLRWRDAGTGSVDGTLRLIPPGTFDAYVAYAAEEAVQRGLRGVVLYEATPTGEGLPRSERIKFSAEAVSECREFAQSTAPSPCGRFEVTRIRKLLPPGSVARTEVLHVGQLTSVDGHLLTLVTVRPRLDLTEGVSVVNVEGVMTEVDGVHVVHAAMEGPADRNQILEIRTCRSVTPASSAQTYRDVWMQKTQQGIAFLTERYRIELRAMYHLVMGSAVERPPGLQLEPCHAPPIPKQPSHPPVQRSSDPQANGLLPPSYRQGALPQPPDSRVPSDAFFFPPQSNAQVKPPAPISEMMELTFKGDVTGPVIRRENTSPLDDLVLMSDPSDRDPVLPSPPAVQPPPISSPFLVVPRVLPPPVQCITPLSASNQHALMPSTSSQSSVPVWPLSPASGQRDSSCAVACSADSAHSSQPLPPFPAWAQSQCQTSLSSLSPQLCDLYTSAIDPGPQPSPSLPAVGLPERISVEQLGSRTEAEIVDWTVSRLRERHELIRQFVQGWMDDCGKDIFLEKLMDLEAVDSLSEGRRVSPYAARPTGFSSSRFAYRNVPP